MARPIVAAVFLCFVSAALAGCAVISPTDPYPPAVAADFHPKPAVNTVKKDAGKTGSTDNVQRNALTLKMAVDTAIANNPGLAAARHETEMAEARHTQALARALPSVSAMGGYTHYTDDQRLMPPNLNGDPGVFGDDIYSADIVITQPLFTGGRLIKEIGAAKLLALAAEHRLSRTKKELVFNVTSVFYSILAQKKVVDALKFSKTTMDEHLRRVNSLIDQKKAARVDRLRTEVRLADTEQKLTAAENLLAIQTRVLANLMGIRADLIDASGLEGDLAEALQPQVDTERSVSAAFKNRSDYLAARAALEAAAKKVDAARAEHWPSVTLEGTYGMRWAHNPSDYPAGTDRSDDLGRVGVFMKLPVFESGLISGKVKEERAALGVARERLRALELAIRLEVETAALNIRNAHKRVVTTKKAVDQAEETLRIEREKYELGRGSITDVLDAQSAMLDSQTGYYKALADFNTAIAQMRLATGEIK
ncbi:MAG: hypothetical protein DRH32_02925 [Deltaproteobacteria bacterium]|nr:MAG: hypothetical protein DRH32_02925 [Deltaproteobacteria bacterium]